MRPAMGPGCTHLVGALTYGQSLLSPPRPWSSACSEEPDGVDTLFPMILSEGETSSSGLLSMRGASVSDRRPHHA